MPTPFPIVDVSGWALDVEEAVGTGEKEWLKDPTAGGASWLFKPVTEKNGHVQGEDWAEKVASHLAELLTVPSAQVELAVRHGHRGSISRNLRPDGWELQSGALVMLAHPVQGYRPGNVPGRPGHSLANIQRVSTESCRRWGPRRQRTSTRSTSLPASSSSMH